MHSLKHPCGGAIKPRRAAGRAHTPQCTSSPLPRGLTLLRATPSDGKANVDLLNLHDELLKEIEERKQQQAALLEKISQVSGQPYASKPAASPSASPAAPAVAPPKPAAPSPAAPAPTPIPVPAPVTHAVAEPAPEPAKEAAPAAGEAAVPSKPPPAAGENAMNVVFVASECAPWSKTGGLGDVVGALPKAMAARGHRVMVVSPRYSNYEEGWDTSVRRRFRVFGGDHEVGYFHGYVDGVDYVFVDHNCFHNLGKDIYGGDRLAILFRCALLSKAALEAVWHVPCGGIPYGDENLVFIANDWHTALVPTYLQAHYRDYGQMTYARCVFVIHNMAHQGRGPFAEATNLELDDRYRGMMYLDDPVGGVHMNVMKAGLTNAHRVVAVSQGYAWECTTQEGGWGLDQTIRDNQWKLRGIVNGIDYAEWSPTADPFLTTDGYMQYTAETMAAGKAACKAALQKELGLPVNPNVPLLGFIGRLDYQKGVDFIRDSFDWLMGEGCQLVMLGSGRADLETALRDMESRRKDQCRGWVGFSVAMAHRITAGCDILLMPSRFEPCGLNQLYAMAYGTVPVVHAVGGLRDTVKPFNPHENTGTGWTFDRGEAQAMRDATWQALNTYKNHRDSFKGIQERGMAQDLSWDNAARAYEEVMVAAKYQW